MICLRLWPRQVARKKGSKHLDAHRTFAAGWRHPMHRPTRRNPVRQKPFEPSIREAIRNQELRQQSNADACVKRGQKRVATVNAKWPGRPNHDGFVPRP